MYSPLCERFGIRYPIFGFTPSPEVAAAITRAGGMGVLGAIRYTHPEQLETALAWMDEHCEGKPYGLDIVMPHKTLGATDQGQLEQLISPHHRQFVEQVLERFGVPPLPEETAQAEAINGWMHTHARAQVDVALSHNIALLANALGSPPEDVIAQAHSRGMVVAALAGKPRHALQHVAAGVDIIVAVGYEAGGHTGDIATMVVVPEIVKAVGSVPVLAAGGIGTGQQIAASLALGAQGAWMGSLWLTTREYRPGPLQAYGHTLVQEKLLQASSSDTVRSRVISGKPARMLRTPWTEAWEAEDSPGTLPMPLQGMAVADAEARIRFHQNPDLIGSPVGQIVGMMNEMHTVEAEMKRLAAELDETLERLSSLRG